MPITIKVIDKDLGWKRIKREFKKGKGIKIEVGLWGTGKPDVNVAYRGAVHEFGHPKMNIPKRPFMSRAFDRGVVDLMNFILNEFRKVVDGKQNVDIAFKKIGNFHETQIKKKIVDGNWESLKPATIKRKKSSRPLIDTGEMRQSVKFKISKGKL